MFVKNVYFDESAGFSHAYVNLLVIDARSLRQENVVVPQNVVVLSVVLSIVCEFVSNYKRSSPYRHTVTSYSADRWQSPKSSSRPEHRS